MPGLPNWNLDTAAIANLNEMISQENEPHASVIIPAYNSGQTIGGCLTALRQQSSANFETIVVDSSPSTEVAEIVEADFPEVHFRRSDRRLLPFDARNLGVEVARSDLLVFTDPDVYPARDWIQRLMAEFQTTGEVIVGAVECHGRKWIDLGTHLCKFDKWLPGGKPRPIDIAPTVNMLCAREVFEQLGGFKEDRMLSDTLFSWQLIAQGFSLRFVPDAVVFHHHLSGLADLLRERQSRGREFAQTRIRTYAWNKGRAALLLIASVLPVRLVRIIARGARNALQAGHGINYLLTFPIVLAGQAAWLAGESSAYLESLVATQPPAAV